MRKFARPALTALVVLLLGMTLVLAGCGGGQTAEEEQAEQEAAEAAAAAATDNPWTNGEDLSGETVNIFGAFVDTDAENFEASMVPFEEQTGIEIEYEGSGDFESLISVRTEGGDPPDIAAFPQPGLMYDLIDRGHIMDVRDMVSEDKLSSNYDQSWRDMAMYGGIEAGVWYRANVKSLVWYPHPEFGDAGYEIPETWDEMIALSDQMVSDGETPWSIAMESSGATGWVATDWMEDIMLRTAPPEAYDQWVAGELPFNSEEVKRAANIMAEIWFNEDYVLGGTNSILTVPFGDGVAPLEQNPPRAWMHRQASFITGFFSEDVELGDDIRYFYLPPIDEEEGRAVLTAGDILSPMTDDPATAAAMRYLSEGLSTRAWVESGTMVSPHNDVDLDWYPNEWSRGYAEILSNADTVRFDASDLMPGQVGTGSFWTGMTNWVSGSDLETVLQNIDESWPESE
ncbi:MAG: extracellular solute-binding protein [Spirochaetes bacterium]|jgi:alpha-glucoside transport system substrate-binding protein|nr:extracellular solute-binding protein [Spirochaetota bacterium]